jgi:hypothetical protein
VADDRKYEHNREVAKLCFEYFKHFTSISTAAALIELTLFQYFQLSLTLTVVGLVFLATTLVMSVLGMFVLPSRAGRRGAFPELRGYVRVLMVLIAFLFILGIFLFDVVALAPERPERDPNAAPPCSFDPFFPTC